MSDKYYDFWGNEYVKVASGGGLVGLLFFIAIVWAVVRYISDLSEEIATAILAVAAIGSLVLSILCVVRHLRVYGYFSSAFIIFLVCLLIQIFEWDGFGNALLICFISFFAFATANGMKKAMIACFILWLFCGFGSDTMENVNITSRILQVMIPVYMLHLIMNEKGRKLIPFLFVVSLLLFSYPYIAFQIPYGRNMFSLPEILYDFDVHNIVHRIGCAHKIKAALYRLALLKINDVIALSVGIFRGQLVYLAKQREKAF